MPQETRFHPKHFDQTTHLVGSNQEYGTSGASRRWPVSV
jgi:hypothetical protein